MPIPSGHMLATGLSLAELSPGSTLCYSPAESLPEHPRRAPWRFRFAITVAFSAFRTALVVIGRVNTQRAF